MIRAMRKNRPELVKRNKSYRFKLGGGQGEWNLIEKVIFDGSMKELRE